jgi:hypothetical protein
MICSTSYYLLIVYLTTESVAQAVVQLPWFNMVFVCADWRTAGRSVSIPNILTKILKWTLSNTKQEDYQLDYVLRQNLVSDISDKLKSKCILLKRVTSKNYKQCEIWGFHCSVVGRVFPTFRNVILPSYSGQGSPRIVFTFLDPWRRRKFH